MKPNLNNENQQEPIEFTGGTYATNIPCTLHIRNMAHTSNTQIQFQLNIQHINCQCKIQNKPDNQLVITYITSNLIKKCSNCVFYSKQKKSFAKILKQIRVNCTKCNSRSLQTFPANTVQNSQPIPYCSNVSSKHYTQTLS